MTNETKRLRFEKMVHPEPMSGCFLWSGAEDRHGYGKFRDGDRIAQAHKVAWEMDRGPVPPGLIIRHVMCRNRLCVNPAHMATGTHKDNAADRERDGMTARGPKHGCWRRGYVGV